MTTTFNSIEDVCPFCSSSRTAETGRVEAIKVMSGPCAGDALTALPVEVADGVVRVRPAVREWKISTDSNATETDHE